MTTNNLTGLSSVLYDHQVALTIGLFVVLAVAGVLLVMLFIRGAHRND